MEDSQLISCKSSQQKSRDKTYEAYPRRATIGGQVGGDPLARVDCVPYNTQKSQGQGILWIPSQV